MQKITTFLWYDGQAEEAATLYTSLIKDSRIVSTMPGPEGSVMGVTFELAGQQFIALNGGPMYKFTEAASLYVNCEDQREVDTLWATLTADGGEAGKCGWLKDKYGLSWQIIPARMSELMSDEDPAKAGRVFEAMMQMSKIDVRKLEQAYASK